MMNAITKAIHNRYKIYRMNYDDYYYREKYYQTAKEREREQERIIKCAI